MKRTRKPKVTLMILTTEVRGGGRRHEDPEPVVSGRNEEVAKLMVPAKFPMWRVLVSLNVFISSPCCDKTA